jgi:predicted aminopeptidase
VEHKRALLLWEEEREFGAFIGDLARELTKLYRSDLSDKDKLRLREEVFSRSKAEWARRITDRPLHRFRGFSQQPLNNAIVMHYVVYLKDLDVFESLYEACGRNLRNTIGVMREAVKKEREPFQALRAWLDKAGDGATAMR